MKYIVTLSIMPHQALLDPQGKAVCQRLQQQVSDTIQQVRIGKLIQMEIEADTASLAQAKAEASIDFLLANPVMERGEILFIKAM